MTRSSHREREWQRKREWKRERGRGWAGKHMSMISLVAEADLMHKPYAHKPIQ
jgi:hypothetical protein